MRLAAPWLFGDGEEDDALVPCFLDQLVELGNGLDAGPAPRPPELKDDGLPFKAIERPWGIATALELVLQMHRGAGRSRQRPQRAIMDRRPRWSCLLAVSRCVLPSGAGDPSPPRASTTAPVAMHPSANTNALAAIAFVIERLLIVYWDRTITRGEIATAISADRFQSRFDQRTGIFAAAGHAANQAANAANLAAGGAVRRRSCRERRLRLVPTRRAGAPRPRRRV